MSSRSSQPSRGKHRKANAWRARHRMKSHDEAHAAEGHDHTHIAHNHPLVPANQPEIIHLQSDLLRLIDELRAARRFAYDTEFIGEQTYHPKICVIQVATCERVTLIDPLHDLDLTALWEVIADSDVEKIVHAGLQDLEPVMRHLDRPPLNVWDTQIAAAFAGLSYPGGMAKLVKELIGVELGQGLKFSQWDHRPLSKVQIRYAGNDVRYLPLLLDRIRERLDANGNAGWAAEECRTLSNPALYRSDPGSQRVRVRGVNGLSPRQRAVLRALIAWRDDAARHQDVPPRSLVKDEVMVDMAREPAQCLADLDRVRALPRPVEDAYGPAIIAAIKSALDSPPPADAPECELRVDPYAHRKKIEALWELVQQACAARSIDRSVVAAKKEVAYVIQAAAQGKRPETRLTAGWRRELLHDVIDAFVHQHFPGD